MTTRVNEVYDADTGDRRFSLIAVKGITLTDADRRITTKEQDRELEDSIRARGVLVPIIVADKAGTLSVVAGRRRLMAAQSIGLKNVPAVVIPHDEHQNLAVELIENLQRADLHPMDEAEAYGKMRDAGPKTIELIASMVGKSTAHVTRRLALLNLPAQAQKALREGKILLGTAMQIARLPVAQHRDLAFRALMAEQKRDRNLMSERDARDWIYQNVMLLLSRATWKQDDGELYPQAGPCSLCPKRTSHEPTLFADMGKDDLCLDRACFDVKATLAWERRAKGYADAGGEVIAGDAGAKLFKYGHLQDEKKYLDADMRPWQDPKGRTIRQLVGPDVKAILVRDEKGGVHEVYRRASVDDLLKKALPKTMKRTDGTPGRVEAAKEKRFRALQAARRDTAEAAIATIVSKVESGNVTLDKLAKILLEGMMHGSWHDTLATVVKRRELWKKGILPEQALRAEIEANAKRPGALLGMAVECAISRFAVPQFQGDTFGKPLAFAAKLLGVDLMIKLATGHRAKALAALKAKSKKPAKKAKAAKRTK